jgi:ATP-dependent DNA helicase RecG
MDAAEHEQREDKLSLGESKAVVETVAAFATAGGGVIRIGYRADGERVGVDIGHNSLENLANDIRSHTDPPQFPSLTVDEDGAPVILVRVEASPIKPVWAYQRPLKRVGRTNQRLSRDETARLMDQTSGRSWDALTCESLRLEDLDRRAMEDFLSRAGQRLDTGTETTLENLRLRKSDGLAKGAALLFASDPQRFVLAAQLKCGRFLGTTPVRFIDEQTLGGNLFSQLDTALGFITRNTRQTFRITGKAERDVIPEYPMDAVREAIANALCHRDYAAHDHSQVRIFDDRLEVWNPGRLPFDLTIAQLYEKHASRPRNPLIAEAFFRARIIEHWGTGTNRMIEACAAAGVPPPEFTAEHGTFITTFRPLEAPVAVEAVQTVPLKGRQERALEYLHENGTITTQDFQSLVSVSERQARRDLTDLVSRGMITREGTRKASRYRLVVS